LNPISTIYTNKNEDIKFSVSGKTFIRYAQSRKVGKTNIYRLIHGHFHIGLVIIQRHPYWPETQWRANMGRGMITRPIWKCPCIKLFITYFRHLEKRHPYWLETKSKPILARANMDFDMEIILVILVIQKCLYLN
jgi:hypothetical protein